MDAENIRELELGGCAMHSWALGLSEKHGGLGGFEWEGNPNSHGDLYDQICAMLWNAYDRGEGDYAILFDGQDISEVAYSDFFS